MNKLAWKTCESWALSKSFVSWACSGMIRLRLRLRLRREELSNNKNASSLNFFQYFRFLFLMIDWNAISFAMQHNRNHLWILKTLNYKWQKCMCTEKREFSHPFLLWFFSIHLFCIFVGREKVSFSQSTEIEAISLVFVSSPSAFEH